MTKIIKLHESDLVNLVGKIISEQPELTFNPDMVRYIEEKMNLEIIPNKQTEILNAFTIRVEQGNDETFSVVIKGISDGEPLEGEIPLIKQREYFYVGEIDGQFKIGQVSMAFAVDILKEDPSIESFFKVNPEFVNQIKNGKIDATIRTDRQNGGTFRLTFSGKPERSIRGTTVDAGVEYPLGTYFDNNSLPMRVNKDVYAFLQSGGINLRLTEFFFVGGPSISNSTKTPTTTVTTGKTPNDTTIKVEFSLVDVFKFDETNFIDEGKSMNQINLFVDKLKLNTNQHGKPLTDHVMKSSPKIIGYASVDANPEQKITGKFAACKSKATRGEYNQCLSEARAKRIADVINEKLTGTGLSFGFFGAGETTKFGPGWTAQSPTNMEQTAPNRRFELTPIPPFSKTIKGK